MGYRVLAATTIISAKILPHTVFLEKYRKFRATYQFDGNERPVPKKVIQRFWDVMNDLKVPLQARNRIKIFSVHGIDTFCAGTTTSPYGAVIGIPPTYDYESAEHLSINQIEVQDVPWADESADKFFETLVLSENAQKFVMAREVLKVQRLDVWTKMFSTIVDILVIFGLHDTLYMMLKLAKKPWINRCAFKIACGMLGISMWMVTEEILDTAFDREITEELAKLGPKYIQGGKEYYEKLCELDNITDNVIGDSVSTIKKWIKQDRLPASHQKEFFTLKLQELESSTM